MYYLRHDFEVGDVLIYWCSFFRKKYKIGVTRISHSRIFFVILDKLYLGELSDLCHHFSYEKGLKKELKHDFKVGEILFFTSKRGIRHMLKVRHVNTNYVGVQFMGNLQSEVYHYTLLERITSIEEYQDLFI